MNIKSFIALLCFFLSFAVLLLPQDSGAGRLYKSAYRNKIIRVGTGKYNGYYYLTGQTIKKLIDKDKSGAGIRCLVESTTGSMFNINSIISGTLDFALVQSDILYKAVNGMGKWDKKGRETTLRSVFNIYTESLTLCVHDSDIAGISDLKGRRVNIDRNYSSQQGIILDVLNAEGIDYKTDLKGMMISSENAMDAFQAGKLDAFFFVTGHPSDTIRKLIYGKTPVHIIGIPAGKDFLKIRPYYRKSRIPLAVYDFKTKKEYEKTVGVMVTLITSLYVSDDIVYAITKAVSENLDMFRRLLPVHDTGYINSAFLRRKLNKLAPIHPGAIRYYKNNKQGDTEND